MDKTIPYTDRDGTIHQISFYDLLESGHNMDKHIINGSLFLRHDHQFSHLANLLKPNSVVYDVGAYIGTFAIPMAIEGMEIHAFEGFPDNFKRCTKNTEPYNVTNYLCAVSNQNYTVNSKFNSCKDDGYQDSDEITYYKFDEYIEQNNLPLPDMVKVDIEGMETIALHAMTNLIENVRPIWQMGYHYKFYSTVEGYPGWIDVEDGGYDFQKFHELDYLIFDERGNVAPPAILNQRGGEFVFVPKEKIKR